MSSSLVIVLLMSSLQLIRVASYNITMSPDHVDVFLAPQSVSFTCTADVALTGCQFRWRDHNGKVGPLLELSQGSLSQANYTNMDSQFTGYCYSGRGLAAGDCGVSLQVTGLKIWMVACRVRAKTGGWTYAWSDLNAKNRLYLPHTLTAKESVVLPGDEARFTLTAEEPLSWCYFYLPGKQLVLDQGASSPQSSGRYRYLGSGLVDGECGLSLTDVNEADNGPIVSWIGNADWTKDDYRFMALIVAHPPESPILSVVYTEGFVTATCVVHDGRPVANITWVLDDDVVRNDSLNDSPGTSQDEWRWPWMQGSIVQWLTIRLGAEDNGAEWGLKTIKCVASHVALAQPLEAIAIINITGSAIETLPLETTNITARTTIETSTTASATPCACANPSRDTITNPTCNTTSILGLLCQEYWLRSSHMENTSCPSDKVYEFCTRQATSAYKSAVPAEEQAKVALDAAKADMTSKATLSKLAEKQAKVALDAAKADMTSKATLSKLAEEQAKVALDAAKADMTSKATFSKLAEEQAKVALDATKADKTSKAMLSHLSKEQAKVVLEAAKSSAKADEETKAMIAKIALEEARSRARAEKARARAEEARAEDAEEELQFDRERRRQLQPNY